MQFLKNSIHRIAAGVMLLLGVTLISFLLMVYFGPDQTFELVGRNPTPEQIDRVRHELGYDRPFFVRYVQYVAELATLDFGNSSSTGERVDAMLRRAVPVSVALVTPGFVIGNLLGVVLALLAAMRRGGWLDKSIMAFAVIGMSISFPIVIISFQIIFSSAYGLDMFPVRGWSAGSIVEYGKYVTVPTLAIVFVAIGYNTRFYRAVVVEELERDYVRTARAFGAGPAHVLGVEVLKNSMIPIITRVIFSLPLLIIGGSLLIESYFGIPGVGKITYEAITAGDQQVLKAIVGLTAILFVVAQVIADLLYQAFDPRVTLR